METKEKIERKCSAILDYIGELESILPESIASYTGDIRTKNAAERLAQKIIESSMDIVAILCQRYGCPSSSLNDYYLMITELTKKHILTERIAHMLVEFRGFRNVLVHQYEKINDETAFERIREMIEKYKSFVEEVINVSA